MVSPESRETLASKERGVSSECQVPEERTVQRDPRVASDPPVSLDPSVWLERRANWEYLDFLDIPAGRDPRDLLASQDSLAQTARREPGVCQAKQDQEDREDQRVPEGREDPEAPPEN